MGTTEHSAWIDAPPARVYSALLDEKLIAQWRVPTGMRSVVHQFEPKEGGAFRISLSYDEPDAAGKTSAHTDIPRAFRGAAPESPRGGASRVRKCGCSHAGCHAYRERVDSGARGNAHRCGAREPAARCVAGDNEAGWRESLAKLGALLSPAR